MKQFRGHEHRTANNVARLGLTFAGTIGQWPRNAEIKNLYTAVAQQKQIRRFDIPMNIFGLVSIRQTGSLEPTNPQTGPKPKLEQHRDRLREIISVTPDATLHEIRDALPVKVSHQTVANELKKLKLVYKKSN